MKKVSPPIINEPANLYAVAHSPDRSASPATYAGWKIKKIYAETSPEKFWMEDKEQR